MLVYDTNSVLVKLYVSVDMSVNVLKCIIFHERAKIKICGINVVSGKYEKKKKNSRSPLNCC